MIPQGEPSTRSLEMLSIYMFFGSSLRGVVEAGNGRTGGDSGALPRHTVNTIHF